jgi:hypothetical protein
MKVPVWVLEGTRARLAMPELVAELDLNQPDQGLHGIVFRGQVLEGQRIAAVELAKGRGYEPPLADAYVRGDDLVATYAPSEKCPLRVQAYWRALPLDQVPSGATGLDLEVSVQTPEWLVAAELAAVTQFQAGKTLRLTHQDGPRWQEAIPTARGSLALLPADGPGCLLFCRGRGGPAYLEMIHPADFHHDELSLTADASPDQVRLAHQLFGQGLEKGVILRARVRGMWLAEDLSEASADAAYREFVAARLPLTT